MPHYEPFYSGAGNRCYRASNPGKPVLLMLHGWQDSSETFQFIDEPLAERFELIRMDWKGHGSSPWQAPGELYHAGLLFQQLAALTAEIRKPYHILAHSMGAAASARFAGIAPDEVASLVLLEGFSGVRSFSLEADRLTAWLGNLRKSFQETEPVNGPVFKSKKHALSVLARMHGRLDPDKLERLTDWLTRPPGENTQTLTWRHDPSMRLRTSAIPFPPELSRELWKRIRCPVLLFMGALSSLKPDQNKLNEILSHFSDLTYKELEGCGHNMHHEKPELVVQEIEAFYTKKNLTPC